MHVSIFLSWPLFCTHPGNAVGAWQAHNRPVTALLAVDRLSLVSGSANGEIKIWNSYTGELMSECTSHTASIKSLCLLPTPLPSRAAAPALISRMSSQATLSWGDALADAENSAGSSSSGSGADFSAGKQFMSVANDADVCVWECARGRLLTAFHLASCHENVHAAIVISHYRVVARRRPVVRTIRSRVNPVTANWPWRQRRQ